MRHIRQSWFTVHLTLTFPSLVLVYKPYHVSRDVFDRTCFTSLEPLFRYPLGSLSAKCKQVPKDWHCCIKIFKGQGKLSCIKRFGRPMDRFPTNRLFRLTDMDPIRQGCNMDRDTLGCSTTSYLRNSQTDALGIVVRQEISEGDSLNGLNLTCCVGTLP